MENKPKSKVDFIRYLLKESQRDFLLEYVGSAPIFVVHSDKKRISISEDGGCLLIEPESLDIQNPLTGEKKRVMFQLFDIQTIKAIHEISPVSMPGTKPPAQPPRGKKIKWK